MRSGSQVLTASIVSGVKQTSKCPERTMPFKEVKLALTGAEARRFTNRAFGRGFFPKAFNGADVTVKDTKRYDAATNGWSYSNFNHHEPRTATAKVREGCAYSHIDLGAKKDEVWTQFYPLLDK
jgi:hypothetical protein